MYQSSKANTESELDQNNNPVTSKIHIDEIDDPSSPPPNEEQQNNEPQGNRQSDDHLRSASRPRSVRSGRISSQIVKLNQSDIGQVKLISLLILLATFAILLAEIAILVYSNSLLLITMLTAFTLFSMLCNFKNNFDSVGQINFLIFLIERALTLSLSFANRLSRGRTKRNDS